MLQKTLPLNPHKGRKRKTGVYTAFRKGEICDQNSPPGSLTGSSVLRDNALKTFHLATSHTHPTLLPGNRGIARAQLRAVYLHPTPRPAKCFLLYLALQKSLATSEQYSTKCHLRGRHPKQFRFVGHESQWSWEMYIPHLVSHLPPFFPISVANIHTRC